MTARSGPGLRQPPLSQDYAEALRGPSPPPVQMLEESAQSSAGAGLPRLGLPVRVAAQFRARNFINEKEEDDNENTAPLHKQSLLALLV